MRMMHKRVAASMVVCDGDDGGRHSMADDNSHHYENDCDSSLEVSRHNVYCVTFECWHCEDDDGSSRML